MKSLIALAILASVATVAVPRDAAAVGCLSGAAVGGVAGHVAGHHGLLGAAAGCAVGHHAAVVRRRNAQAAQYNGGYQNGGYQNGQNGGYPNGPERYPNGQNGAYQR